MVVTSARTSVPSVPNNDLMGSVRIHIPGGKSRFHICILSIGTRRPPDPPFLWKNSLSEELRLPGCSRERRATHGGVIL